MSDELPGPRGYCSTQLLPYLGNKRALLQRMRPVFAELAEPGPGKRFIDPFAGSGSVARLARAMGYAVDANDWEPYSQAVNLCWLGLRPSDLEAAFGGPGGVEEFLRDWNAMHPLAESERVPADALGDPYIAKWYAPERTESPRLGEERLFYTAENAAFIDRVRSRAEAEYGRCEAGTPASVRLTVLLAALTLEAATHANTSGVFKAYHRGFGGHGKDALKRILGRMELERPILVEAPASTVTRLDASEFASGRPADLAYIDPPYNQHQYGSNYHVLNTILRWDGTPMPLGGDPGVCSAKAGIPEAWKATRSAFCSKPEAGKAIEGLLDSVDAACVVFSWNGDGHLSGEELAETLSPRGRLETIALEYTSYRGGRQSASRRVRSVEYLFVLRPGKGRRPAGEASRELSERKLIDEALAAAYDPRKVRTLLPGSPFFEPGLTRAANSAREYAVSMQQEARREFLRLAALCACADVLAELDALVAEARASMAEGKRAQASRDAGRAATLLRKLAHAKHYAKYSEYRRSIGRLAEALDNEALNRRLAGIDRVLAARMGTPTNDA